MPEDEEKEYGKFGNAQFSSIPIHQRHFSTLLPG
jgi:hypothetical protein